VIAPDLAGASEILSARTQLGRPLVIVDETESTNDDAKAGARDGAPHGAVWIAEKQRAGRGRRGRSWVSPPGENLTFSLLLRIPCPAARVPPLALAFGLAVRDAVAKILGDRVMVKWPNDVVVVHGSSWKKIAGVLVESSVVSSRASSIVVGIGLNVHTRVFPEGLAATSVALESQVPVSRAELLADILAAIDHDADHVAHRGLGIVHARLRAADVLAGRIVERDDGLRGRALGIDVEGRLVVERDDGTRVKIASGEVIHSAG
jgi:BirA family transcriptional regulator, biotin operon repressor / biotin---[acetyl-CoA-carboxylase] ligase